MSRYYLFIMRSFYTFRDKNMQELKENAENTVAKDAPFTEQRTEKY
jgi:hypothetical protein